ncbi:helix-turn-helix transcriptional regulator [Streptosporangium amethystogenes]|uniref:helix-turn-helix transcriptional regulator n=1 Tax=Streptosporangium amethystogenes TaxID=2002 RepID=UPI0004CAB9DF|nr:LuxR family transcriptional regulator [Streptosporangium amethystogenes]
MIDDSGAIDVVGPVAGGGWPTVGREEEVREILAVLATSSGSGVLLTGEPGVGKTRLADLVLDLSAATGALIIRGAATEATRGISGVGIAALRVSGGSTGSPSGLSVVSGLLAGARDSAPRGVHDAASEGGGDPARWIVLGIDDADQLDAASAAVVGDLVRTGGVTLLLTARSGAPLDGPLARVCGRGPLVVLPVANLSRAVVLRLLTDVLEGPVDGLTADALWRITRGNPLLLRRVVGIGLETGDLARSREVWSWRGSPGGHPRLHELVAADLATLGAGETKALEYVALTGSLPRATAEHLAGPAIVGELAHRAVITLTPRGGTDEVTMSHPLHRQALLAGIGPLRRRQRYRELVAAAGEAGVPDPGDPAAVLWRLEADLDVPASQALVAGGRALASGDPVLAESLAHHVPGTPGAVLRGQALIAQGRAADGERLLADHGGGTAETVALRSLNLFWGLSRPGEAHETMARHPGTERSADLRVAELGLALFTRATPASETGPPATPARGPLNPLVADAATVLRAYLLTFRGRPARAAEDFDRGPLRLPARWPAMRGSAAACHVHALILAGRLREALLLVDTYYEEAVRRAEPSEVAIVGHVRGHCRLWAGSPRRALAPLREARALVDEHVPFPMRVFIGCEYAVCVAALGRSQEAFQELDRLRELIPGDLGLRDRLEFSRIRLLAHSGRLAHATDLANRLADRYLRDSRLTTGVECAYYHVRLRPSSRAAARLREAAGACDSPLFELFADHAEALAARDDAVLRGIADRFAELGYLGLALEAASAAPGGGHPARRRLDDLVERCDGHRPPWPPSSGGAMALTSREREMCELAAAGLSDSAIAANLGVSVRTVTNLLGRAYHKLGVHSRRQLGAVLPLSPDREGGG